MLDQYDLKPSGWRRPTGGKRRWNDDRAYVGTPLNISRPLEDRLRLTGRTEDLRWSDDFNGDDDAG
jgi:hypothetical protein